MRGAYHKMSSEQQEFQVNQEKSNLAKIGLQQKVLKGKEIVLQYGWLWKAQAHPTDNGNEKWC